MEPAYVALLVGAMSLFASVFVASYNNRRARERVAQEANRAKKAAAYQEFMDVLLNILNNVKEKSEPIPVEKLTESMFSILSTAMIYGSPTVIAALQEWRRDADNKRLVLRATDRLLRAMREDLGESNKRIVPLDLVSLFIVGGRPVAERELSKLQ